MQDIVESPIAGPSTTHADQIVHKRARNLNADKSNTSTAAVNMSDDEHNNGGNGNGNGEPQPPRVTPATNRRAVFERAIRQQLLACTDDYVEGVNRVQLNQDIAKSQRNWDKFELEHMAVVSDELPAEVAQNVAKYEDADKNYGELMGKLRAKEAEFMQAEEAVRARNVEDANARPVHFTLNTPDMLGNVKETWGKFAGDYAKWQNFRDLFKAGVHENEKLTPIHKFQLLQNALVGEAARVVGKWQITEANYERAWQRLYKTYDDDYLGVQTILNRLLNFEALEVRTHDALRSLVDVVHECTNQLAAYIDVQGCDAMLLFLVVSKLDSVTFAGWETHRQTLNKEMEQQGAAAKACVVPPLVSLTDHLETQARILMHTQKHGDDQPPTAAHAPTFSQSRESSSSRGGRTEQRTQGWQGDRQRQNAPYAGPSTPKYPPCILCGQNHGLYHCPLFKQKDLASREKVVEENNLCEICLKVHPRNKCGTERKDCSACGLKGVAHNTWLCKTREAETRTSLMSVVGNTPEPLSMRTHLRNQPRWERKRAAIEPQGGQND